MTYRYGKHNVRARARSKPGTMNKTEAEYAEHLEASRLCGEIEAYKFEPMKLRLAKLTTYTPDFLVVHADGFMEFHEVKGFWEDDARVKIKVAADAFPWFGFVAVKKCKKSEGGGWKEETF